MRLNEIKKSVVVTILVLNLLSCTAKGDPVACREYVTPALSNEIQSYQAVVDGIVDFILNGKWRGSTYKELVDFVDLHPIRRSGYQNLEDAINYMMVKMRDHGLQKVKSEQVTVPQWIRGKKSADLLKPYKRSIPVLGLGNSVGTPEHGIMAQVIVVKSFEELEERKSEVPGKIVVYNQGWNSFTETNIYKLDGASYASQFGARAALIQSITPFSLNTLHTGIQNYWNNVTRIPVACITMEDAELLYRLQQKGLEIEMSLIMHDYSLPMTMSRNIIGEITGKSKPFEYVAVSGHVDTLDVGQGAMDDAGGVWISVMALAVIRKLNLVPSRTLQSILWTSHEAGLYGAQGFVEQHKSTLKNYSVVFEADSGTFLPYGLNFAGSEEAGCIVQEVLKLMKSINATAYAKYPAVAADISLLQAEGVPGLSLGNENEKYFWYHHSSADSAIMVNSTEVDICLALWTAACYVLADISVTLPREV